MLDEAINRRSFLQRLGLCLGGIAAAPALELGHAGSAAGAAAGHALGDLDDPSWVYERFQSYVESRLSEPQFSRTARKLDMLLSRDPLGFDEFNEEVGIRIQTAIEEIGLDNADELDEFLHELATETVDGAESMFAEHRASRMRDRQFDRELKDKADAHDKAQAASARSRFDYAGGSEDEGYAAYAESMAIVSKLLA